MYSGELNYKKLNYKLFTVLEFYVPFQTMNLVELVHGTCSVNINCYYFYCFLLLISDVIFEHYDNQKCIFNHPK